MSWTLNPFTDEPEFVADLSVEEGYIVETREITLAEAAAQRLTLANTPPVPAKVKLDIISGGPQKYNFDYVVIGNELIWGGFALELDIEEGDTFRITYPL